MSSTSHVAHACPPRPVAARALLADAEGVWRDHPWLARSARLAWRGGFASGAAWMRDVREAVRARHGTPADPPWRRPPERPGLRSNALGLLKNGGAAVIAVAVAMAAAALASFDVRVAVPLAAVTFVLVFYAVEGQMVFLFPLLDDLVTRGGPSPSTLAVLRACRARTVRAGGTLVVMRTVMPISARMVFGGLLGRGVLESWCLGCIAVVLWYEEVSR